jgi:hypothetical protein
MTSGRGLGKRVRADLASTDALLRCGVGVVLLRVVLLASLASHVGAGRGSGVEVIAIALIVLARRLSYEEKDSIKCRERERERRRERERERKGGREIL